MNILNFQQESNLNRALNKPTAQSSVYQPENMVTILMVLVTVKKQENLAFVL